MQRMKFYITMAYAAFFLVALLLLSFFMIAALSFNPFNQLPTALGVKLIIAANQLSENSRLIIILFVTSSLFLTTLVGAYLMRSFYRSFNRLTYTMNIISYAENGLKNHMQATPYLELNQGVEIFNEMITRIDHVQNKLKEQILLSTLEINEINKYTETKVDELNNLKIKTTSAYQSKSEFLSTMSHELRTPLNAIIGYSEILQEDAKESGYTKYYMNFENIIASAKNLLVLINATLEVKKSTDVNLFKLN